MLNPTPQVALINSNIQLAKSHGVLHVDLDEVKGHGRKIRANGQEMVNFGSCSYLGLETDPRLIASAHEVIDQFGVHFSSSRSYLGLSVYKELEDLLAKIFGAPTVVTPSTTLGHMAMLPLLIGPDDFIILDQQVHSSIAFSVRQVHINPVNVERLRHNRMDYLENRLQKLSTKHRKVWYLADGVYSMYGDLAPLAELSGMLERYGNFHLYIDDAHGMSWKGQNGRGVVAEQMPQHDRMTLVTSLGKGFGTSGGAIICKNEAQKELVRNCGGTLIFSGPLQPANLGAALASARIHLSDEIYQLQGELEKRITHFRNRAIALNLPMVNDGTTPVFYMGLGSQELSCTLCADLMEAGFYTCVSGYPSVPFAKTGLRILVNCHQTLEDIDQLLDVLSGKLVPAFRREGQTTEAILEAFRVGNSTSLS